MTKCEVAVRLVPSHGLHVEREVAPAALIVKTHKKTHKRTHNDFDFLVSGIYIGCQYIACQTPYQEGAWGWCCCCSCAVAATCTFGNRTTTTTTTVQLQPVCKYFVSTYKHPYKQVTTLLTNHLRTGGQIGHPFCNLFVS